MSQSTKSPLDTLMRPYRRRLYLPLLPALAAVVLFVWQSALLADLFAGWLNAAAAGQRLDSDGLYTLLPLIMMCLLLRSLLSLIKERLLQKLSLHIRRQLRRRLLASLAALGPARSHFGSDGALSTLLLAPEFYAPLRQLGNDYHAKAQAQAAAEALQPLLDATEQPRPSESLSEKQIINLDTAPSLQLENVSVSGGNGRTRLAAVSFAVAAGGRIGIGGASGSGKSSLLQALLGFSAYQGRIFVNGENYAGWDKQYLQTQTGYLAQTATLLPGSIADNLRLAKADADEAQMQAVLRQVGLWDWVRRLPQGLHTPLGERGQGLSGGQQQRLSLAQLLLRDASLWLLNEPAAHLDEETAMDLYRVLGDISAGKTVLLVSHDLAAVPWLDAVVVLEGAGNE